jgi:hypothetical protein
MATDAAIGANEDISKFLDKNGYWVFKSEQTAPCFTHARMCPCYPGTVIKSGLENFKLDVPLSDMQKKHMSTASSFSVPPTTPTPTPWWGSWWGKRCFNPYISVDEKKDPPMIVNIAGVACTDYTALGKQRRAAGMTDAVHSVWRAERKELGRMGLEDVFFVECSDRYNTNDMLKASGCRIKISTFQ